MGTSDSYFAAGTCSDSVPNFIKGRDGGTIITLQESSSPFYTDTHFSIYLQVNIGSILTKAAAEMPSESSATSPLVGKPAYSPTKNLRQ